MSQLEAIAGSVSECSLLSSGTISGQCRHTSSSRSPGITSPQSVMAMAPISSSTHVIFDRPSQLPFSNHDPINYDTVIPLSSPLGVPATPTSSLSSSFATNSRTTSRVVAIRRDNSDSDEFSEDNSPGDDSPETTSAETASSVSSATPATDPKSGSNGQGNKTTTKTENNGTPPGHATSIAASDPYIPTTTVTSYYTSSQQDAASPLTTVNATPTTVLARCASETGVDMQLMFKLISVAPS
ncbi:hypothetical protein EDB19DRAFT_816294 [Suillus lakei]|nr:hypothetical protein EDB19DRAFT_816294 [Suillus lakei]